jgi:hypothetical protein
MTKCDINRHAKALYCYEYKGRYCSKCGLDSFENPWLMDFHHVDPNEKEYTISHKIRTSSFDVLKGELDKCILICSHCHRTLHAEKNLTYYKNNLSLITSKLEHIRSTGGKGKLKEGIYVKYKKEDIVEYINQGKTIKEIADILNETTGKVANMLRKFKLETTAKKRIWLDDSEESIIRDYVRFGYTIEKIMTRKKMTEDEIISILNKNSVSIRKKLSDKVDIEKLKELLTQKMTKVKMSKILGCHEQTIYYLIKKHNL